MNHLFKKVFSVLTVSLLLLQSAGFAHAAVILFQDDTFFDVESETVRIGSNDAGVNNTAIQFGNDLTSSENGTITWNISTNTFGFDHSVDITGGLTTSGTATFNGPVNLGDGGDAISVNSNTWDVNAAGVASGFTGFSSSGTITAENGSTLNANGTVNLGDGGDAITVNSNTWDVSAAGVASGFTGLTSTGSINLTGATFRGPQGAADPGTCSIGETFYNTTSNILKICTALNTWSPLLRTDTTQSFTSGTLTFNAGTTLTSNGTVNFTGSTAFRPPQGAADPGTCAVGQVFYNTTSNALKVCTATNTWTIAVSSGGADLLDGVDSSQFLRSDTSDNFTSGTLTFDNGTTLTLNGVVNIGDGGDAVSVNSNTWDVSSAGVASGFTGFTSTGTVNLSGTSSMRVREVADEATAACTTLNEVVLDTNEDRLYVCTVVGSPGTWVGVGAGDAGTLDALDSTQFLRSDTSDTFTSGQLTMGSGTTLAVSGNANIGDGTGDVFINSDDWDISSAGVASGFTGFSSSGAINFSTATSFLPPQGAADPGTCSVGQLFYNTTSNTFRACTAVNTWTALGGGGTPDFEAVYTADADKVLTTSDGNFTINSGTGDFIVDSNDWNVTAAGALDAASITSNGALTVQGTTTLNGVVNIGDGGDTVIINSNDWDISATGDMTGIGSVSMNGLLTGTAGATLSGAATSINSSSNFATNLGTGTSTGQVSLGGNSNCVAVDSNTWDVSCAGVLSGLTGISSSGTVNFSGSTVFRMSELTTDPVTCTPGQQYFNTVTNTLRVCVGTNVWSSSGAAGTQYVFAYDTTIQSVGTAGVFQNINFNTSPTLNGWSHTPGTASFTAAVSGVYMANVSARVAKSGGANTTISIRGAINGTEVPGSQIGGTASGSSGDGASTNFIFTVVAGDVITIQMTGGTSNVQIVPTGSGTVVPSISLSIWRMR